MVLCESLTTFANNLGKRGQGLTKIRMIATQNNFSELFQRVEIGVFRLANRLFRDFCPINPDPVAIKTFP